MAGSKLELQSSEDKNPEVTPFHKLPYVTVSCDEILQRDWTALYSAVGQGSVHQTLPSLAEVGLACETSSQATVTNGPSFTKAASRLFLAWPIVSSFMQRLTWWCARNKPWLLHYGKSPSVPLRWSTRDSRVH